MFQGVVLGLEDDLDLVGAVIITIIITITTITIIITTGKIGLLFRNVFLLSNDNYSFIICDLCIGRLTVIFHESIMFMEITLYVP